MYKGGTMKKVIDKVKPKPKELDEWTKYMNHINDLLKVKKDNRSLEILMECLRKMENRDK